MLLARLRGCSLLTIIAGSLCSKAAPPNLRRSNGMGIGTSKRTAHVETGEKSVSDSRILQRHSVRAT